MSEIPTTGIRSQLHPSIDTFLKDHPTLHLGGQEDFHDERNHHLKVFGIHNLPQDKTHPIGEVEFTAVRGPHGTIPVRVLYPKSGEEKRKNGDAAALVYFHGGGYTIGSVDSRRRRKQYRILSQCNGIFTFADHYLPRGVPPSNRYISPGMQEVSKLGGQPPAAICTSGFDPLRDVGVEYASKLQKAKNEVRWHHYQDMTHGFLQMIAWSDKATECVKDIAKDMKDFAYGS